MRGGFYRHIDDYRRQWLAVMLLAVYVPMVLLSSMHIHSLPQADQMPNCELCTTSTHHSGHITSTASSHDECLFCRVLNTSVIIPDEAQHLVDTPALGQERLAYCPAVVLSTVTHPSLRAPPSIL